MGWRNLDEELHNDFVENIVLIKTQLQPIDNNETSSSGTFIKEYKKFKLSCKNIQNIVATDVLISYSNFDKEFEVGKLEID